MYNSRSGRNKNSRRKPRPPKKSNPKNTFPDTDDLKYEWQPCKLPSCPQVGQSIKPLFISPNITCTAMESKRFAESFEDSKHLYYNLKWQSWLQLVRGECKLFKSRITNRELILFRAEFSELKGTPLYIVGDDNTQPQHKSLWQMVRFMNVKDIQKMYHLNQRDLPLASRPKIYKLIGPKDQYIKKYLSEIHEFKNRLDLNKINGAKFIEQKLLHKADKLPLVMGRSEFLQCIQKSIERLIRHNEFEFIIHFHKKANKPWYTVPILLPIEITKGNYIEYIGITLGYDECRGGWYVDNILVDDVDVRHKLCFYDTSKKFEWFRNNISDLHIVHDDVMELISRQKEENDALRYELSVGRDTFVISQKIVNDFVAIMNDQNARLQQQIHENLQLKLQLLYRGTQ